ncbi:MAG: hypothetical protein E7356_03735 [Clostridiales bacterium]|nr:hypothetical protein [Clostridiales bacterium]
MKELKKDIEKIISKENTSTAEIAQLLGVDEKLIIGIIDESAVLSDDEVEELSSILKQKTKGSRKLNKILDLIFRFATTVMALVVVLLCINGYSNTNVMVALLAIGLACISITSLPKIEK